MDFIAAYVAAGVSDLASRPSAFAHLQTFRAQTSFDMRCFYVLAHGTLCWLSPERAMDTIAIGRPEGFWCHRFVLAADPETAEHEALQRVLDNLEREFRWLSSGAATVQLKAAEVSRAPMHKLLRPENKGHTFYEDADGS